MASVTPVQFTLRLVNKLPTPRVVIFEPWTGEYQLAASTTLDIAVEGSPKTPLEIELDGDRIIVYAFDTTDAMLTAYRDGRELRSEHGMPPAG